MFSLVIRNGKHLFTKEHKNILSATFVITLASLLSSLLGILRNRLLISHFYSHKEILDVYWASFRIPDTLFQILIVSSLSAAFIPVFSSFLAKKNFSLANTLASSLLNLIILSFTTLSILAFIFAPTLSLLITHNFSPFQLNLMTHIVRLLLLSQLFLAISSFLTSIIQANKRFLPPAISPLLYNLGIIAGIYFLSDKLGIFGPVYGVLGGAVLHLLFQLPFAHKLGFTYSFKITFSTSLKKVLQLSFPRFLSLSIYQLEQTFLLFFATTLSSGSLTMLSIAQQLTNLPTRLFGIPLSQASLPFLARVAGKNDYRTFSQMLLNSFLELIYLSLPAIAVILVLRIPLVRIAYGAPSFPWKATVTTGRVVAILSLAILFRSITHLFTRAFYALQNTTFPLFSSLIAAILNIGLSWILLFHLHTSIYGLAIAILLSSFVESLFLGLSLISRLDISSEKILKPLLKLLTIFILTTLFLWLPMKTLDKWIFDTTKTIPLLLLTLTTTSFGLVVYFFLSFLLKVDQFYLVLKVFKKLGNWRKVLSLAPPQIEV